MNFVKLACPNCGADIELSKNRKIGICTYCGTKIIREQTETERTKKKTVPAAVTVDSLLTRIRLFIEDKNYQKAVEYSERVLDMDPYNADAYLEKLLAQAKVQSLNELSATVKPLDFFNSYQKTIRFAPSETAATLISAKDETWKNYNVAVEQFNSDLAQTAEALKATDRKLKRALFWSSKNVVPVHFILCGSVLFLAADFHIKWLFFTVLFFSFAGLVFILFMRDRRNRLENQLAELTETEKRKRAELAAWYKWVNTYEQ